MSRSNERIGWKRKARPALDVSIVLVLATLSLAVGRAHASDGIRVEANLRYGGGEIYGGYEQLVEVPRGGLEVDLWSNPGSGATVRPGQRIELFFEANADCYVTVISIDPAGRARRLFPTRGEDGWIRGDCVYRLPDPHDYVDLLVTGPRGEERVFALASLEPVHDRYPTWWHDGPSAGPDYGEDSFFRTGWVIGDPVYEFGMFCEYVVPHPRHHESYSSAWVSFRVGGWKPVGNCCGICGGLRETRHNDACVEIHWYNDHGRIDFRAHRKPIFLNASCVCDSHSHPRGKVKWTHSASGWDRHDKDRDHDDDRYKSGDRKWDRGGADRRKLVNREDEDRKVGRDRSEHGQSSDADSGDRNVDRDRGDGRLAPADPDRVDRRKSDYVKPNDRGGNLAEGDNDRSADRKRDQPKVGRSDRKVERSDAEGSKVEDQKADRDKGERRQMDRAKSGRGTDAHADRGQGEARARRDLGPDSKERKKTKDRDRSND